MCGRYYIDAEDAAFRRIMTGIKDTSLISTGEIFPTNIVPAINALGQAQIMQWGFPRYDGKGQIINARSETAAEKPAFRKALQTGRCLIPATNYFEWRKEGSKKQKYALRSSDRALIYMAAISKFDPSTDIPLFVILTKAAADGIAFIHDRMPVILAPGVAKEWLRGIEADMVFDRAEAKIEYSTQ